MARGRFASDATPIAWPARRTASGSSPAASSSGWTDRAFERSALSRQQSAVPLCRWLIADGSRGGQNPRALRFRYGRGEVEDLDGGAGQDVVLHLWLQTPGQLVSTCWVVPN